MSYVVFGGRSPIALALCRKLSLEGKNVHLMTRNADFALEDLARAAGVTRLHSCDLEREQEAVKLLSELDQELGGLRGLAFSHRYRGPSSLQRQHVVEVTSPYLILDALHERHREAQCAVVLTTSPASRAVLTDQDFGYHASKAALAALVRFGAVRFADRGLRINGVSPGSFVFKDRAADFYRNHPHVTSGVERVVPAGRMASVDEVANVMSFLLSDESSYVNGQIVEVDGGISCLDGAGILRNEADHWADPNV